MKTPIFFFAVLLAGASFFFACGGPSTGTDSPTGAAADSASIAGVIHRFYTWYDAFLKDEARDVNFTTDDGQHLKLDTAVLKGYYENFRNTGLVSEEFIQGEYAFFKKCEQLWQNEPLDEVPSCLDGDKYFCAQDWETSFWTQSPVRIQSTGENRVTATLYDTEMERSFELVKENGKWLLAKVECDMGVE